MPTKPDLSTQADAPGDGHDPIVTLTDLAVHFQLHGSALSRVLGLRSSVVKAVDGVNLTLGRGEVLGLVGESGSGKTTLGRTLLGLAPTTSGSIVYHGSGAEGGQALSGDVDVTTLRGKQLRRLRTELQMVFQDPHAALNPSMTIEKAVGHPLEIHKLASGAQLRERVVDVLEKVGLTPADTYLSKYPSDLSGGQKQRAVIARAIILEPEVLVADEPVSMLDMSVRAKILQLMLDLKRDLGLTYVYITHDLASAKYFCDRVAIMYLGRIVEVGPTEEIFAHPRHPYTKALLAAIPDPDPDRMIPRNLPRGEIPDAAKPPLGCSFHPRCPEAVAACGWESRDLRQLLEEHWTRRDPDVFDRESAIIGSLDHLDDPSTQVSLGKDGDAVGRLLDEIHAEDPDEPLWQGISSRTPTASGLEIGFIPADSPALRRAGGVDVACVLYPDEPT